MLFFRQRDYNGKEMNQRMNVQEIMDKIKDLVAKGNVSRIAIRKGEREILNVPVTVGVAAGIFGIAAAKWAVIAAVLATVGFGCKVEVVKADGAVVNVMDEEKAQKAKDFAGSAVAEIKENIPFDISFNAKKEAPEDEIEVEIVEEEEEKPQE